MQYVIDGYNLIRSNDRFSGGSLRDQRERLLRWLEIGQKITVVFDGPDDVSAPPWTGPVQVLFSQGKEADDIIKERVDRSSHPRDVVVVTNDRAIQRWVRGAGATVLPCASFLKELAPKPQPRILPETLPPERADDINEELRNVWKLK
jgi:predicted RNA-binding protein with PIN domain